MNVVKIWRKGASKPTIVTAEDSSYLSLCQILEASDDVDHYTVTELIIGSNYTYRDRYLPGNENYNWPKWGVEKTETK